MAAVTFKNDAQLRALKPSDRFYDAKDEKQPNLAVRVAPVNKKGDYRRTFVLVTRFPGSANPTRARLGEYREGSGGMTLDEARKRANKWLAQINDGIDPREEVRRRKAEAARKRDYRFGAIVEDYLAQHVKGQRRGRAAEQEIRTELVPVWKDRPVTEISRRDVVALVKAIADRPAPYHAHNVFGHIRGFFNWAMDNDICDGLQASPCAGIKPSRVIGERKPRQRVLSDDELFALWRATARLGYPYGPLVRLLAITGQRKSEVAGARWREFHPELVRLLRARQSDQRKIDWSQVKAEWKIWTVPPERFKSDATHTVPLSNEALLVIETLPHFAGEGTGDHLFSLCSGAKPVDGFGKAKRRLDRQMLRTLKALARHRGADAAAVELPDFVLHDIRRTVRTRLSALRFSTEVAEMVIGHGKKGLERVYNQHEFADEIRDALTQWAGRLKTIINPVPANVVDLQSARNG